MSSTSDPQRAQTYVLLPSRGLHAHRPIETEFLTRFAGVSSTSPPAVLDLRDFIAPIIGRLTAPMLAPVDEAPPGQVRVIDSVHENGPKLVQMTDAAVTALTAADAGFRAVPVRFYAPAQTASRTPASPAAGAGSHPALVLTVECAVTGQPIAGVKVVAFTSLAAGEGAQDTTDASGRASLALGGDPARLDSLYVEAPPSGHWGFYRQAATVRSGDTIPLAPVVPAFDDCVRRTHAPFAAQDGSGVSVAVIDTGVGPHPDLATAGGANAVPGEPRSDWQDNGMGHGTHVAGIIAANPAAGAPMGLAPGVRLWSGRVFSQGDGQASNYSIMKAMILAAEAGCDLINLSLAADDADTVLQDAISDASLEGLVVFVAAGNQGQQGLAYPARCADALAISAFGALGAYPADTPHAAEVGAPQVGADFFANFSNWGQGMAFTAPGVGVISAAIGQGYGVRSGTSMACAAATGMAARLLAANPALRAAPRDQARAVGIQNMLHAHAMSLNFGFNREGAGRL